MSIANECMILNIHFSMWEGKKLAKGTTADLTAAKRASPDSMRVNKHLVAKERIARVQNAVHNLRAHWKLKTLPWKDNGDRLLPRSLYFEFMEGHQRLMDEFDQAVDKFITWEYPTAMEQAELRFGDEFNPDDYPRPEELRPRFAAKLVIDGVMEAKDFRVTMDKTAAAKVRADMEAAVNDRIAKAMGSVWQRLGDALTSYAMTMADQKAIFRDSKVENLIEILDLLPAFNVMNDPELTRIGEEIRTKIGGYAPEVLRKNFKVRAQAAKDASEILTKSQSYFNGLRDDEED